MRWRVLATARFFSVTEEAVRLLRDHDCELIENPYGRDLSDAQMTEEELVGYLGDASAMIGAASVTANVMDRAPLLRVISRRGVGYERVDVEAATERGIAVSITAGAMDDAVADHTFALLLAVARQVPLGNARVLEGDWRGIIGTSVYGKQLGIVGFGRIGQAVARRAVGFGMSVLTFDPYRSPLEVERSGVRSTSLENLLIESDFVSIHAAFTPETRHLIGPREFRLMKSTAIILNTARGGILDEDALFEAIRSGRIGGAGLDTFSREPPDGAQFAGLEKLVLSPHSGGYTWDSLRQSNIAAASNAVAVLEERFDDVNVIVNPGVRHRDTPSTSGS